ncbi:MAG: hypothetical protein KJO38_10635 [Gammaproteobacteria bacterium]|nr:hypothetical protein [Gammaproteobacteria bacterium]
MIEEPGMNAERDALAGMDMDATLASLLRALNAAGQVQPGWYQRSHGAYELISYLNNAMGLYLADNIDAVPIFLDRAHGYLQREDAVRLPEAYRQLVLDCLAALARAVAARDTLSERSRGFIPPALLGQ